MTEDDIVLAFFPCVRFEAKIPLGFRGQMPQQKKWNDKQKLEYAMQLHDELHDLYKLICKLIIICMDKNIKLIVENPATQPHYLTTYFPIKPKLIDKNRRDDGDYYKKPTQYWFINCEPKQNLVLEPLEIVRKGTIAGKSLGTNHSRTVERSMIHPQYARRFIKQYIL